MSDGSHDLPEQRLGADDLVPETHEALKRLGHALVSQLEPPHEDSWTQLEFTAKRVLLPEHGETHAMRLSVSQPQGEFPLIPRPEAMQACAELDRISGLGQSGAAPIW